ncbi:sigma-70 family RNA polymerase sigma factor [Polycladidibacter hongkongensis]|uniref:sigma-70 family RNA polymerase sigma factor n=1 Tax=Polycladidibacter hongkongensis TaxID=1647556 RepID=UPI001AD93601|nr:sigma-70 family RNA polymerase sigma factor [Pseudovibrio hongkongensis]
MTISFDERLVEVGSNKCRDAFRELFDHFAPRLKSFYLKGGSEEAAAEELVQETFVLIWRKAALYDPQKAAASTWIYTIARNLRIDRLRKEKAMIYKEEEFFATKLTTHETQTDVTYQNQMNTQLAQAIAKLPAPQAQVITLAFFEEATHSDIAKRLALPLGTVKSRLRLAFTRLAEMLEGSKQ